MSVSVPLRTLSPQVAVWQVPPVHTPLEQSAAPAHFLPSAHVLAGAQLPPQSTSVSVPFFTVSVQEGAAQLALEHTRL
jgi:hypothetical protein